MTPPLACGSVLLMRASFVVLAVLTACGHPGEITTSSIHPTPEESGSSGQTGGGTGSGGDAGAGGGAGSGGDVGAGGAGSGGQPSSCSVSPPVSGGACTQSGYPFLCDVFTGGGCPGGSSCLFDSQDIEFECYPILPAELSCDLCDASTIGEMGEPCVPGLHCHENRCARYCCDDSDCAKDGMVCVPDFWLPNPLGVCAPSPLNSGGSGGGAGSSGEAGASGSGQAGEGTGGTDSAGAGGTAGQAGAGGLVGTSGAGGNCLEACSTSADCVDGACNFDSELGCNRCRFACDGSQCKGSNTCASDADCDGLLNARCVCEDGCTICVSGL